MIFRATEISSLHYNRPRWRQGYPRKVQQEFQFNHNASKTHKNEIPCTFSPHTRPSSHSRPPHFQRLVHLPPIRSPNWTPRLSTTARPRRVSSPDHQFMRCCRIADKVCNVPDFQFPPAPFPCAALPKPMLFYSQPSIPAPATMDEIPTTRRCCKQQKSESRFS